MEADQVDKILDKYQGARRDKLIPILQEVQEYYGYLDELAIKRVGRQLKLPTSKIYGIATFYNQFSFTPRGKYHIRICHGSACHVNGGMRLIREIEKLLQLRDLESTQDGEFSLEIVACLGACSRAPVIEVNGVFYACCDVTSLTKIIDSIKKNATEKA
jgi:NADH:ubiquinone oxidoreductase subunit E